MSFPQNDPFPVSRDVLYVMLFGFVRYRQNVLIEYIENLAGKTQPLPSETGLSQIGVAFCLNLKATEIVHSPQTAVRFCQTLLLEQKCWVDFDTSGKAKDTGEIRPPPPLRPHLPPPPFF